jgi:acyl-coenzyme A thioesterase PaaI-like protein
LTENKTIIAEMAELLHQRMGEKLKDYTFPPPVFAMMQGEFVALDIEAGVLKVRFPVLEEYQNPYGAMQGGMVAAAVDNTLGPLSVLVAPPNVTRTLEMTYSRAVMPEMRYILVEARLVERKGRKLIYSAEVFSSDEQRLARAKAVHFIFEDDER